MHRLSIMGLMGAMLLAACGGHTLTSSTTPPPVGSSVAAMTVSSSSPTISADGSTTATITATATDAKNNLVKGAVVAFTSNLGGLAVTQATTDVNGVALATLQANGAPIGSKITVIASSTGVSANTLVTVANTQQTINLTTNLPQIPSDGTKSAIITAVVVNASNQFLSGIKVSFAATSGGISPAQGTTDVNGSVTATLSTAGDKTSRRITVTTAAGSTNATVPVDVTGTKLTVVGPPALVLGSTGTYTVALTDSSTTGIPNVVISLTSSNGNTLSANTVTTDATGQKTFTLTAIKSGNDVLTAMGLGATAGQPVSVSNQSFQFTTPASLNTNVNLSVSQTLVVNWSNGGTPQVGQTINFATTRGTLSAPSAVTDASGNATVTISSNVAGPSTVTASNGSLSAQVDFNFIATNPTSVDVQASPATIPTLGQSTITAIVRDPQNNLVQGQVVNFNTVNDITGGTLSVASVVTDSQGRAQTVYTASSTPSATNGVTVSAVVRGTSVSKTTTLTVAGISVGLTLGTGGKIVESTDTTQYSLPYTVFANDSAGNPVPNVNVTLTVHPLHYLKGIWAGASISVQGPSWKQYFSAPTCPNEDANFNGILDPGEDGLPQDSGLLTFNPDGNQNGRLDPGGVAVTSVSSVLTAAAGSTTPAPGSAVFNVNYPENFGGWVEVQLIASTSVSGTETSAVATFWLPIAAHYITDPGGPPGNPSPFGQAKQCNNPL